MLSTQEMIDQLKGFPRVMLLVEKRGQNDSHYLASIIQEHESEIKATYIALVQQDHPEVAEALEVTEFPTLILFESGKERRRTNIDGLLS